jgi:hypothetical protein
MRKRGGALHGTYLTPMQGLPAVLGIGDHSAERYRHNPASHMNRANRRPTRTFKLHPRESDRGMYSSRQMSMPKPVCPNMATTTPPRPAGAQTAQNQHAGLLKLDAQPSAARIPSFRGRGAEGLCLGAASLHSGHLRGIGPPNRGPGRTVTPGDGAAGDQWAQDRPACPAMAATQRLRAVPSQRLPGAMILGAPAVL